MPQHLMSFMMDEQSAPAAKSYSLRQAALLINRPYITLNNWANQGKIRVTRIGRIRYMSLEDIAGLAGPDGIDFSALDRRQGGGLIESVCLSCGATIRKTSSRVYCNKKCESDWKRSQIPVSREWLEEKYLSEGIDANAIARMVGRDGKTVWSWLKMHGIPTRARGMTGNGEWWKQGKPNPFEGKKHTPEYRKRMSEIARAEGRVPYDPAVGSYMKGRKGADTPNWKGGITPERQAFYQTDEWKKVERLVKRRDRYNCQRCGKHKIAGDGQPFDIHHIVSFAFTPLRSEPTNLVYLCEPCHYWVHGRENTSKDFIKEIPS